MGPPVPFGNDREKEGNSRLLGAYAGESHSILLTDKNLCGIYPIFFGEKPLYRDKSCDIMTLSDEFMRKDA